MDEVTGRFYTSKPPSISEIWGLPKPDGRFNDWGERKWLVVSSDDTDRVNHELVGLQLSSRAKLLYRTAQLTKSSGIEFVLFSDAQFPRPVLFKSNEVQIIPCFKPFVLFASGVDASDERQAAMMKRGKFVYDGWIPNNDWSSTRLEYIVESLDTLVNLFSLVGSYHAYWEPKYNNTRVAIPSHIVPLNDFLALANTVGIVDSLPAQDRQALSRSAVWITNALKDESPVQRFLLLFVSIEALITYIERESAHESPLRRFAKDRLTKLERKENRESCIADILASDLEPTKAITEAYFRCVVGSKALVEDHLNRVMGNDQASRAMFVEESSGKTLWQLRNDIAHGNLNVLNDYEIAFLSSRVSLLEEIARTYLRVILSSLAGSNFFSTPREPILTIPASQAIGTPGAEYQGPIDMAEYYINVEGLASSFVRIKGDAGSSRLQFSL
jgi:hypothetical protein